MMNKALLIIDMQKGSFAPPIHRHDTEGVVSRINQLSAVFRENGDAVIYIQHDGSRENAFVPGTTEWEILDDLNIEETDLIVSKIANDAFYKSELQEKLNNLNIDSLYITGCATDFCVESCIQSALTKEYNVTVVSDGHTTGNRPHQSAEKVIEHYNWVWQNMIPTEGVLGVNQTASILDGLHKNAPTSI